MINSGCGSAIAGSISLRHDHISHSLKPPSYGKNEVRFPNRTSNCGDNRGDFVLHQGTLILPARCNPVRKGDLPGADHPGILIIRGRYDQSPK